MSRSKNQFELPKPGKRNRFTLTVYSATFEKNINQMLLNTATTPEGVVYVVSKDLIIIIIKSMVVSYHRHRKVVRLFLGH